MKRQNIQVQMTTAKQDTKRLNTLEMECIVMKALNS